jgi:peptidoglycan hydrolase-like protein with peptidoglycan-binding domain
MLGVVRHGDWGDGVAAVQSRLRAAGACLAVDGAFGPITLATVRRFQRAHGLVPDGQVGAGHLGGAGQQRTPAEPVAGLLSAHEHDPVGPRSRPAGPGRPSRARQVGPWPARSDPRAAVVVEGGAALSPRGSPLGVARLRLQGGGASQARRLAGHGRHWVAVTVMVPFMFLWRVQR